jgi:hypothetical protein
MENLSLFLKSYSKDFQRAKKLLESVVEHNSERIPTWIACPKKDLDEFKALELESWINCINEEDIPVKLATQPMNGIRAGYLNQEVLKLGFAELNLSKHYFCLDSDGLFLKEFMKKDFLTSEGIPKIVLVEDKDLQIDNLYYNRHWVAREVQLKKIAKYMLAEDEEMILKTCHNFQLFTTEYLNRFKLEILEKNQWDYLDCILHSPYEFSWYNYFVQSRKMPYIGVEPYFKMIHSFEEFVSMKISGSDSNSISRAYMGVVVNSNFSKSTEILEINSRLESVLGEYLSIKSVIRVAIFKFRNVIRNKVLGRKI